MRPGRRRGQRACARAGMCSWPLMKGAVERAETREALPQPGQQPPAPACCGGPAPGPACGRGGWACGGAGLVWLGGTLGTAVQDRVARPVRRRSACVRLAAHAWTSAGACGRQGRLVAQLGPTSLKACQAQARPRAGPATGTPTRQPKAPRRILHSCKPRSLRAPLRASVYGLAPSPPRRHAASPPPPAHRDDSYGPRRSRHGQHLAAGPQLRQVPAISESETASWAISES